MLTLNLNLYNTPMKITFLPAVFAASGALILAAVPSLAAPRQYVIVVAEGVSPQILDLDKDYLRTANEDQALTTSFDSVMENGKAVSVNGNAIADMKGLLSLAKTNGYKTGLVTTGDISTVAPMFYNMTGDTATALSSAQAQYDFIGGGGRTDIATAGDQIKAMGGSYLANADDFAGEVQGRVLSAQAPGELAYALDRDSTAQASLSEMASLAMDKLGDAPYVLIVHDGLAKKALDAHDTPALLEEVRELETITADALSRRDENPDLGIGLVMTGSSVMPRFTAGTSQTDKNNAFFILNNLGSTFTGAGMKLKGADAETINTFADPNDGEYRAWNVTATQKQQIAAGTLNPETALRASYEPILKMEYVEQAATPTAYAVGIDADAGLVQGIKAAVSTPAMTK